MFRCHVRQPGESPYHTVHPTESRRHPTLEGLGVNVSRQNRSNSWSDVLDESRLAAPEPAAIEERVQHDHNRRYVQRAPSDLARPCTTTTGGTCSAPRLTARAPLHDHNRRYVQRAPSDRARPV